MENLKLCPYTNYPKVIFLKSKKKLRSVSSRCFGVSANGHYKSVQQLHIIFHNKLRKKILLCPLTTTQNMTKISKNPLSPFIKMKKATPTLQGIQSLPVCSRQMGKAILYRRNRRWQCPHCKAGQRTPKKASLFNYS